MKLRLFSNAGGIIKIVLLLLGKGKLRHAALTNRCHSCMKVLHFRILNTQGKYRIEVVLKGGAALTDASMEVLACFFGGGGSTLKHKENNVIIRKGKGREGKGGATLTDVNGINESKISKQLLHGKLIE